MKKTGSITDEIRTAAKRTGATPEAQVVLSRILRGQFERDKEAAMPAMKKSKTSKAKQTKGSKHEAEIAQLRTDMRALQKTVKSLDGSLRKEQSAASSKRRAATRAKVVKAVKRAATFTGKQVARPVVAVGHAVAHPIESAQAVKAKTFWLGRQIKRPFAWLAHKSTPAAQEA